MDATSEVVSTHSTVGNLTVIGQLATGKVDRLADALVDISDVKLTLTGTCADILSDAISSSSSKTTDQDIL